MSPSPAPAILESTNITLNQSSYMSLEIDSIVERGLLYGCCNRKTNGGLYANRTKQALCARSLDCHGVVSWRMSRVTSGYKTMGRGALWPRVCRSSKEQSRYFRSVSPKRHRSTSNWREAPRLYESFAGSKTKPANGKRSMGRLFSLGRLHQSFEIDA